MGDVTVTGATGLLLGINQDSGALIQGLQQVGEQQALRALSQLTLGTNAFGADIATVAGGATTTQQTGRVTGVEDIDQTLRSNAGTAGVQDVTSGGTYAIDSTASLVDIGSTTTTPLDQDIGLQGSSTSSSVNVMDGDLGTVEYNAGPGQVNYDAAGGNSAVVSGAGQDTVHTMGGSDTVYGYAGTPTVTGNWSMPGSSTTLFSGGVSTVEVIDGVVVQNTGNDTINAYDDGGFFEDEYTDQTINTVQGGQDDVINGHGSLVLDTVSGSSIVADGSLSITGGSSDTISASQTTQIDGLDNSTIQVSVPGTLTFIDGSSGISDTVTGSNATIFGAAGLDLTAGTTRSMTYHAAGGNETLDGGLSGGALYAMGGTGNDTLIGGNGQNILQAGSGNDLLKAGSGTTEFDFIHGQDGGHDIIQDFGKSAANIVKLSGFDATPASIQSMLDNATIAGGSTTVSLGDKTQITFVGVTDLKVQNFKS